MTSEEIKALQLAHQHLTSPTDMHAVAQDLCGVQAQFLSNAMHAIRIRSTDFSEERAQNELIKSWTVRGTMHVFSPEDLPLFLHQGRKHMLRPCDTLEADKRVSAERKAYFAQLILRCVESGADEREQLRQACQNAGMTAEEEKSIFNSWGGLLRALCETGRLCHKVQERKAFLRCQAFEPMAEEEAWLEKARRYFTHFAPATIHDAAYFFGTTQNAVKRWLDALPVRSALCNGRTYYWLEEDTIAAPIPECIFLAGFDQLMLGYQKNESLYLPQEYLRGIFNLAGIVMPAILWNGSIAGRWKKTGSKLRLTMFEPMAERQILHLKEHAAQLWPELTKIETGEG